PAATSSAPRDTAEVSRGTNTVMLPGIASVPPVGQQLVESFAVDAAIDLVVDHDGWRAGAVAEAIHRLQRHFAVGSRVVQRYADGLLGVRRQLAAAHRLAGFGLADLDYLAPGRRGAKIVVEAHDPVQV